MAFINEIEKYKTYIEEVGVIKEKIKSVADKFGVETELGVDTPSTLLDKISEAEVSGGGGSTEDSGGQYFVQVIDYDGTVLKQDHLDTGATFTLPNAPSHDGLIFQSWSCSQEIVDNTITVADNNVMIGAVYTTASGLNEFNIELTKVTGLDVTLNMNGTKDWGDGTSDDLTTHTYANYGDYMITCNGTTMTTSSSVGLFGQSSSVINYYCMSARLNNVTSISSGAFQYCYSLTNVVIPNNVTSISSNAFQYCYSLTNVVIPNNVTSINSIFQRCYSLTNVVIPNNVESISSNAFQYCYSLKNITIPNNVKSISGSVFYYCHSLTSITIPNNVTSIGNGVFQHCYSLKNVVLPNNVTKLGGDLFYYCYSLKNVVLPNNVESLSYGVFQNCYSVTTYDFSKNTSIPTLSNTTAFTAINKICKIYVPDALYDEWIVATNWSTYADYIYKVSEMPTEE